MLETCICALLAESGKARTANKLARRWRNGKSKLRTIMAQPSRYVSQPTHIQSNCALVFSTRIGLSHCSRWPEQRHTAPKRQRQDDGGKSHRDPNGLAGSTKSLTFQWFLDGGPVTGPTVVPSSLAIL